MCNLLTHEDIRDKDAYHYRNLREKFSSLIVQVPYDVVKQDNDLSAVHYNSYPPFIVETCWDGKVPEAVKALSRCICEKGMVLDGGYRRGFIDSFVLRVLDEAKKNIGERYYWIDSDGQHFGTADKRVPSIDRKEQSKERYATFNKRMPREQEERREQVELNGVKYPMYHGNGQWYACAGGHIGSMGGLCPFDLTEFKPTGKPLDRPYL